MDIKSKVNPKYLGFFAACCCGLALVFKYEGFIDHTYKDVVGVNTIGYGHTGPDVKAGMRISVNEAKSLALIDYQKHWNGIAKYIKVNISQYEAEAYTSFAYNVGVNNFKNSTLLKKLNKGKYVEACGELKKWVYAGGKKLNGLVKRREEEYKLCMKGNE